MYCRKCGTQNDDNAHLCIKCGEVLQQIGGAGDPPVKIHYRAIHSGDAVLLHAVWHPAIIFPLG